MTKRTIKMRIKKNRIKAKKNFYPHWRPVAQKLFFPIVFVVLAISCVVHEYNLTPDKWEFTNTAAASEEINQVSALEASDEVDGHVAMSGNTDREAGADGGTTQPTSSNPAFSVIQKVAKETDTDWRLLWSICQVESHCNSDRIGDNGKSYGAFQIFLPVHKSITIAQAQDMEFAARWTANHGKDYRNDPAMYFKKHNGIGKTTNQWYIDRCLEVYKTL